MMVLASRGAASARGKGIRGSATNIARKNNCKTEGK